jgi:uncharacterized protein YcfJ
MNNQSLIVLGAVAAITTMEVAAMALMHIDGVALSAAVAAMTGIATRAFTIRECERREVLNGRNKLPLRDRSGRYTATA